MDAELKANELIKMFEEDTPNCCDNMDNKTIEWFSIKRALICVNEMIEIAKLINGKTFLDYIEVKKILTNKL